MDIEQIKRMIKEKVLIEGLELEDITPDDIGDQQPLFGEGLGLDSVEGLEIILGLEEYFNVNTDKISDTELKKHFFSVETIAQLVLANIKSEV